jgi:hypothetical protein
MTLDFTLKKYGELCNVLLTTGYQPVTVLSALSESEGSVHSVILRHDVDRRIRNALRMAEFEHSLGIHTTYYFRYPFTFVPDVLRAVESMGHEVGYHYEVLSKTKGDHPLAINLFEQELTELRRICDIKTISMHGSPLSRYDNRDLWETHDFREYGLVGDASLSFGNLPYLTDTGRDWSGIHSLRDTARLDQNASNLRTTDDLIRWIRGFQRPRMYLSIHPERWAGNEIEWLFRLLIDFGMNAGKKLIAGGR